MDFSWSSNGGASPSRALMELEEEAARERTPASGSDSSGEPDRLSAMPDNLLHAIMSFLKARQAIQTCVLATRWKHLWHSMPCLDIDYDEFRAVTTHAPPNNPTNNSDSDDDDKSSDCDIPFSYYYNNNNKWEDFEDFADCLMQRCNIAMLDSLRLHVSRGGMVAPMFGTAQAGGWLRRAMKYYCTQGPAKQREGFSSGSWHLKRLYLCNVALDNLFAKHVSSVCHSLEDMELVDCPCEIRAITSQSLKNLVLKSCRFRGLTGIASPTLKSLVIAGGMNTGAYVLVIEVPAIARLCLDVPPHFATRISVNQPLSSMPRLF